MKVLDDKDGMHVKVLTSPHRWPQFPFLLMMNAEIKRTGVLFFCEETNQYYIARNLSITGVRGMDLEPCTTEDVLKEGWIAILTK